jgi:mannose-6-phosphate isomerase-like protein (cupin superfamily)
LRGDLTGLKAPVTYELNGGGRVTVYREEDQSTYAAVVKLDGAYPQEGKIARNQGRTEKVTVLEGHFEVRINSETHKLSVGNSVLVPDSSCYRITGAGTCFTLVHDDKDGQTEIIDDMG